MSPSAKADKQFSQWIRERDKKCVKCGKRTNLTCSHFWGRTRSATRYDKENCDTLCWLPCHYQAEHEKQGWYTEFKVKQLGKKRFEALRKRANSLMPRSEAIKQFYEWYKP